MNIRDVMKKIEDNGLSGKVHTRDLLLGAQNPDALNKIVDAKIGYMNAGTDAERGMYSAEAKMTRAQNGYQLSDDGSKDITSQMLSGKSTGAGAVKVGTVSAKRSQSGTGNAAFDKYRATIEATQRKAQEDALGKMSALTGGYASSSAATAATAAGADYSQLLAEKELELAEAERNRAENAAETEYQKQLEKAKLAASLGDYSYLEEMGIDLTAQKQGEAEAKQTAAAEQARTDYEKLLSEAEFYAKYGDFSKLKALGIDTSSYEQQLAAKSAGGGGTVSGSENRNAPVDIYAALKAKGATDFGTAYAMLLNAGYSSTEADTMAEYFANTYLTDDDDEVEYKFGLGPAGDTEPEPIGTAKPEDKERSLLLKAYGADVYDAKKKSNKEAYDLIESLVKRGSITVEEANALAEKYHIVITE